MGRKRKTNIIQLDADERPLDIITLGTKEIAVPQEDGEWPPYAMVQASRVWAHDPRVVDEQEAFWVSVTMRNFEPEIYAARPGYKWCADCGEWVHVRGFSPKADTKDGLHPYCKQCRNQQARRQYASARRAS